MVQSLDICNVCFSIIESHDVSITSAVEISYTCVVVVEVAGVVEYRTKCQFCKCLFDSRDARVDDLRCRELRFHLCELG